MAVSVESNFLKTNGSSVVPAASQGVNSHVQLLPLWAVQTQESISTVPEISVRPVSGDVRRWLGTSELGFQLLQLLPCVPAACRGGEVRARDRKVLNKRRPILLISAILWVSLAPKRLPL